MRWVVLTFVVAACAPVTRDVAPGQVALQTVTLYRDTLVATTSDGALCTAVRPAPRGPWRTVFAGCPHAWPVEVARPMTGPRLPLSPAIGAPWVVITTPAGPLGFAPPAPPTG